MNTWKPHTRLRTQARNAQRGYTLIELAMIIGIMGMLAMFGVMSFGGLNEKRDAQMVETVQADLQSIVSQGMTRMDVNATQLMSTYSANVLTAVQAVIGQNGGNDLGITITNAGNQYTMTITKSQRTATYSVSNTGDVNLVSISPNFTGYCVDTNSGPIATIHKTPCP